MNENMATLIKIFEWLRENTFKIVFGQINFETKVTFELPFYLATLKGPQKLAELTDKNQNKLVFTRLNKHFTCVNIIC